MHQLCRSKSVFWRAYWYLSIGAYQSGITHQGIIYYQFQKVNFKIQFYDKERIRLPTLIDWKV